MNHLLNGRRYLSLMLPLLLFFLLTGAASGVERVIVLNTAVSPILHRLNLDSRVVGVTYKDEIYQDRTRIGSHLSPNIELIKALQPDLIIVGSERAFPDELANRLEIDLFRYDPRNLREIMDSVLKLGELFDRNREAQKIVENQKQRLQQIRPLSQPVTVVFEISQQPLKLAGQLNVVNSIIEQAGGKNLIQTGQKHVLISPEKVLMLNPDLYLFQNGPMNKNPTVPEKRSVFKTLKSRVLEVDQLLYTRAGLNAFDAVLDLHRVFKQTAIRKN